RPSEPLPRRRPLHQSTRSCDLGQPLQGDARVLAEEADARGDEPQRGGQSARRLLAGERAMRAVALHRDVIVVTSQLLQAHCTLVRGPAGPRDVEGERAPGPEAPAPDDETFVIDSPVLPE